MHRAFTILMTGPKRVERDSELQPTSTGPSSGREHDNILQAHDLHGDGMASTLSARTTIIERQNSWNNRRDAARDFGLAAGSRGSDRAKDRQPSSPANAAPAALGNAKR